MNALFQSAGLALLLCGASVFAASEPASAPGAIGKEAAEACEKAVAGNVREMRGRQAQDVQFVGAKRHFAPATEDETSVRGEGRYRSSGGSFVPFTYRCVFSAKTNETTGVVFSETGRGRPEVAEKPWQPDLANLSTEACETAVAAALKRKHPRVGRIAFGSDSRQLRPGPNGGTRLEGQGGVERAAGMSSIPFTYRCDYDTRTSKIVGVQTSE